MAYGKGKGNSKGKMFHGAGTKGLGQKAKQNSGSSVKGGKKKKMGRAGTYDATKYAGKRGGRDKS